MQKHELAAEVEAASGGKQTVLATVKGHPTYMNVIPAFRLEELGPDFGTGLHPAFIVGGKEISEIYIGTYQAVIRDGEALSLPDQDPAECINFDQAREACTAAGDGFHLMTNWEWAAIALWCAKNGITLRGNNYRGQSYEEQSERGTITKYGRTATGSGPDGWRHDSTPFGIADLVGNVWEWQDGLKLISGKIIMPVDNDFRLPESDWPETGAVIDMVDEITPQVSDAITERDWDSVEFSDLTTKDGVTAPLALKHALLSPSLPLPGRFYADNNEDFEALPLRGGSCLDIVIAGLAAVNLYNGRDYSYFVVGFRPAFIDLSGF